MKTSQYSANGRYRGHPGPSTVQGGPQKIQGRVTRVIINPGCTRITIATNRNKYHGAWPDENVEIGDWVVGTINVNTVQSDRFGFFDNAEVG